MLVYSTSLMQTKYAGNFLSALFLANFPTGSLILAFKFCRDFFSNSNRVSRGAHQVSIVKYEKGKCDKNVTPIPGTVTFKVASFISKVFAVKADRKILLEPDLCLKRKMQFLSFARLPTGSSFSPFQNLPRSLLQLYQVFVGSVAGCGQSYYYSIVTSATDGRQSHISLEQKPQALFARL